MQKVGVFRMMLLIYGQPSDPHFLRHVLSLNGVRNRNKHTNGGSLQFSNARNCWWSLELCQCLHILTHKCAESAELSSFSLSACGLKDLIGISCLVCFVRSKFKLTVSSNCQSSNCKEKIGVFWNCVESSLCVLAPCKHFPCIACHCKGVNQLSFFLLFSALIRSDLRRHNVNSGIMNLDVKAVSGDSFTMIVLPTWMLDFYCHNNSSCKRVLDKVLMTDSKMVLNNRAPWDAALTYLFFSLTPVKKTEKTSALRIF